MFLFLYGASQQEGKDEQKIMKKFIAYIISVSALVMVSSCIENDLSYPALAPEFTSFEVEGQKTVTIDKNACTIHIVLAETADISNVRIVSYETANNAEVIGGLPEYLDLTDPVKCMLRVYRDQEWIISAEQPIERYIRCDNQVGEPDIDPVRKIACVFVAESQSLLDIKVNDMKLEPEGSVVKSTTGFVSINGSSVPKIEECHFPMVLDCVVLRYFTVVYDGQEIEWTVKFLQKAVSIEIDGIDPWTCSAFVSGRTNGQGEPVVEYRNISAGEWTEVENIKVSGTSVYAEIRGLDGSTEYTVRLSNGIDISDEVSFTTSPEQVLPNLSFDDWYEEGAAWMPNASSSTYVWDSANPGTAGLGTVPTTPEESDVVKGKAARLQTSTALGMLAAGNIYVGKFVKVAGLGAELDWGYPFTSRPLALKGYYKYTPKAIDMAKDPYKGLIGQSDQCQIQILLTDWDGMFRINTSRKQFVDFDNDPSIIAHGSLISANNDSQYVEFTIPLVYRNGRIPEYIVVVAAASRYGDYFTGGVGSVLKVDEFELIYDPDKLTDDQYQQVFGKIRQQ